jgi:glycosyltransferase involved in cell wall biosynthesis
MIRLGEQGRRRARERFGWETHLDAFGRLYQQLGNREG